MAAFTCNLHILFPQRVAYQHVGILHELFIFLSIALSQVAPQLFLDETMDERTAIQRLESLAGVADREGGHAILSPPHRYLPIFLFASIYYATHGIAFNPSAIYFPHQLNPYEAIPQSPFRTSNATLD
jgi:hypothetical protein